MMLQVYVEVVAVTKVVVPVELLQEVAPAVPVITHSGDNTTVVPVDAPVPVAGAVKVVAEVTVMVTPLTLYPVTVEFAIVAVWPVVIPAVLATV